MAVTRANIAIRALRRCGRLAYNEESPGPLNDDALQAYDEVYDELAELNIVDWGSTASVPDKYVFHVVSLVALRLTDVVGVSDSRFQRISISAAQAEPQIRRLFTDYYTPKEIRVKDY